MSLVGPPERPVYVEQFRQSIRAIWTATGKGRSHRLGAGQRSARRTSVLERTKYDLWYIENWSLALDIKILIRTALQWLVGMNRNAY